MFMARSSSKHTAKVAAGGRQRSLARNVQAKPAVAVRSFRPPAKRQADNTRNATGLPSDLRRAGIIVGTQDGDFGFGANFLDGTPSDARSAYTWTPSGHR